MTPMSSSNRYEPKPYYLYADVYVQPFQSEMITDHTEYHFGPSEQNRDTDRERKEPDPSVGDGNLDNTHA